MIIRKNQKIRKYDSKRTRVYNIPKVIKHEPSGPSIHNITQAEVGHPVIQFMN